MVKHKGGKRTKNPNRMSKMLTNDDRFADIATNPLFKEIPRKKKKVVVDERFQAMFTDDRFKTGKSGKIDKRGRCLDLSSSKHLASLYDMNDDDTNDEVEEIGTDNEDDKTR